MKVTKQRLTNKVYDLLRTTSPFCNIDLIIIMNNKFLLGKRIVKHYTNYWSLPGGRIMRGEKIQNTIKRIAFEECSCYISKPKFIGVYENVTKHRHDINLIYIVSHVKGIPKADKQHSQLKWFSKIPTNTIIFQVKALKKTQAILKDQNSLRN